MSKKKQKFLDSVIQVFSKKLRSNKEEEIAKELFRSNRSWPFWQNLSKNSDELLLDITRMMYLVEYPEETWLKVRGVHQNVKQVIFILKGLIEVSYEDDGQSQIGLEESQSETKENLIIDSKMTMFTEFKHKQPIEIKKEKKDGRMIIQERKGRVNWNYSYDDIRFVQAVLPDESEGFQMHLEECLSVYQVPRREKSHEIKYYQENKPHVISFKNQLGPGEILNKQFVYTRALCDFFSFKTIRPTSFLSFEAEQIDSFLAKREEILKKYDNFVDNLCESDQMKPPLHEQEILFLKQSYILKEKTKENDVIIRSKEISELKSIFIVKEGFFNLQIQRKSENNKQSSYGTFINSKQVIKVLKREEKERDECFTMANLKKGDVFGEESLFNKDHGYQFTVKQTSPYSELLEFRLGSEGMKNCTPPSFVTFLKNSFDQKKKFMNFSKEEGSESQQNSPIKAKYCSNEQNNKLRIQSEKNAFFSKGAEKIQENLHEKYKISEKIKTVVLNEQLVFNEQECNTAKNVKSNSHSTEATQLLLTNQFRKNQFMKTQLREEDRLNKSLNKSYEMQNSNNAQKSNNSIDHYQQNLSHSIIHTSNSCLEKTKKKRIHGGKNITSERQSDCSVKTIKIQFDQLSNQSLSPNNHLHSASDHKSLNKNTKVVLVQNIQMTSGQFEERKRGGELVTVRSSNKFRQILSSPLKSSLETKIQNSQNKSAADLSSNKFQKSRKSPANDSKKNDLNQKNSSSYGKSQQMDKSMQKEHSNSDIDGSLCTHLVTDGLRVSKIRRVSPSQKEKTEQSLQRSALIKIMYEIEHQKWLKEQHKIPEQHNIQQTSSNQFPQDNNKIYSTTAHATFQRENSRQEKSNQEDTPSQISYKPSELVKQFLNKQQCESPHKQLSNNTLSSNSNKQNQNNISQLSTPNFSRPTTSSTNQASYSNISKNGNPSKVSTPFSIQNIKRSSQSLSRDSRNSLSSKQRESFLKNSSNNGSDRNQINSRFSNSQNETAGFKKERKSIINKQSKDNEQPQKKRDSSLKSPVNKTNETLIQNNTEFKRNSVNHNATNNQKTTVDPLPVNKIIPNAILEPILENKGNNCKITEDSSSKVRLERSSNQGKEQSKTTSCLRKSSPKTKADQISNMYQSEKKNKNVLQSSSSPRVRFSSPYHEIKEIEQTKTKKKEEKKNSKEQSQNSASVPKKKTSLKSDVLDKKKSQK